MTDNKTSEAVEELFKWLEDPRPTPAKGWDIGVTKTIDEITFDLSTLKAIAEKYLRLEDALYQISIGGKTYRGMTRDEMIGLAKDATAYDPLLPTQNDH